MLPQIQIKYLKPKALNGYTKPLGRLSKSRMSICYFMTAKGQRNGNFHLAWRLPTRVTKLSLETGFPCSFRLRAQLHHSKSDACSLLTHGRRRLSTPASWRPGFVQKETQSNIWIKFKFPGIRETKEINSKDTWNILFLPFSSEWSLHVPIKLWHF